MNDSLRERVLRLEDDFFAAVKHGQSAITAFNSNYVALLHELEEAARDGTLPDDIGRLAHSSSATIVDHASMVLDLDVGFDDIVSSAVPSYSDTQEDASSQPALRASLPLFRYFLDNVCSPYPETEAKERLVEEVREAGWRDFDRKKLEDWFNRKRHQSGFVAILHQYCDDDREVMRHLCRTALYGATEAQAGLPAGFLDDVENMFDLMQAQHDELAEVKGSTWVDNLATGVRAILGHASAVESDSSLELCDDNADVDLGSDTDSSDWSDTDVDVDDDDDDEPAHVIIGAKRKLNDSCCNSSSHAPSRPLARSLSMASSTSSSSKSTSPSSACSFRSFSGSSASSVTSVEWDDHDDVDGRPAKRSRTGSCRFDADSVLSTCASKAAPPATILCSNPLYTNYRTKRERDGGGLSSRTRSMKRSRYAALSVASQISLVSDAQLSTLSGLCSLAWTPVEVVLSDLDANLYTVDCTQPDVEPEPDDYAVPSEREDDEPAKDLLTWSKLQIRTIICILLATAERSLPNSLAQSPMYSFDVGTADAQHAMDLEEMMRLSPEALSAMFDAMNGLAPAHAEETVAHAEDAAVTSSADLLLSLEATVPAQDVSTPARDAPVPTVDAAKFPLVVESTVELPALGVDTSAAALDTSAAALDTSAAAPDASACATEEPLSPPEELPSPISSPSSEGDSPPALSDDSGLSSRSSSVESDNEQDSLLLSPAALSANYSRLNDELSCGKGSNTQASQFQVDFGTVAEVTTAHGLSCASELLERYLNGLDTQMTWA